MTESWDHRHGNGVAKHKLRRQAENKTGICGKPRLTQLQGRSDSRDAPIGQAKFVFMTFYDLFHQPGRLYVEIGKRQKTH